MQAVDGKFELRKEYDDHSENSIKIAFEFSKGMVLSLH